MSSNLAQRAVVVHQDTPGIAEERIGRILTFFGVPWISQGLTELVNPTGSSQGATTDAVFGSADTIGAALASPRSTDVIQSAAALYVYATENRDESLRVLAMVAGGEWSWKALSGGTVKASVTSGCPDVTGPMSGIEVEIPSAREGGVVAGAGAVGVVPIVTVDGGLAFLRTDYGRLTTYFCASPSIVDVDAPVHGNYYDVKQHFVSAVSLVMFVTSVFRNVMWRPEELGACLIIDDPLLKSRYGFCDFPRLRDLMRQHGFTTNVAFIPWNWRRTTRAASEFFRREAELFSVSIHGCDHVAAEFGATSTPALENKARLAQSRMRAHQQRTGIEHDPVMVFPQGVFSRECPSALKRNGFVAAVNTEIAPVNDSTSTAVREVWNTAILAYGTFPIYTRRYASHGVENFAFDLLLGKPCFIVAHHEFFRDRGTALVALIEKLSKLNCTLHWRSPREVIRRAYRRRTDNDTQQVEMFGSELTLANSSDRVRDIHVSKQESDPSLVVSVDVDGTGVECTRSVNAINFRHRLPPGSRSLVRIVYRTDPAHATPGTVKYRLKVAARRVLSEFRDEYVTTLLPVRTVTAKGLSSPAAN